MLHRVDDLEADLIARRQRADDEGWQGEIEGIELTLDFLRGKRDDVTRRLRRTHDWESRPRRRLRSGSRLRCH
jgi:hypothetical protein